eukprot:GHUV01016321.1.p1 GENE.GHUV01016321.1~~GHUV01016321.1.p1  ORF type:complete len:128 (+),score=35.80 GHUV01016321.1:214-597(+)
MAAVCSLGSSALSVLPQQVAGQHAALSVLCLRMMSHVHRRGGTHCTHTHKETSHRDACDVVSGSLLTNVLCVCFTSCVLQAPLDSIKGTVNAVGPSVELSQVFGGLPAGANYNLRYRQHLDNVVQEL